MTFLPFATFCLLVSVVIPGIAGENIWDKVVRQQEVFLEVHYKGRSLSVWKQEVSGSAARYYVTPLCILKTKTLSCSKQKFVDHPKTVLNFEVKLWDHDIATVVQKALRQIHIDVELGYISILPMDNVRFRLSTKTSQITTDNKWRPFLDIPNTMEFEMYPKNKKTCYQLLYMLKKKTDEFLRQFKPYFEFTLEASSTTSRHVTIKANFLQKSSFYSSLTNNNANKDGTILLTSDDANKLAHDVFNSATYDEEVSKGYQASDQEDTIIKELLKVFEHDKLQSDKLTAENWDSVFWDNIFTRPDVQTSFLKDTMKYDGKKKMFKMDDKKAKAFMQKLAKKHSNGHDDSFSIGAMFEGFGLEFGKSHGETQSDTDASVDAEKTLDTFSMAKLQEGLKKSKANVEWKGNKFVQKNFELYRVNTKNLQSATETAFNRKVTSKEKSTLKVEIKRDTKEDKQWGQIYDNTVPLPTTTTTTTTEKPTTKEKITTRKTTTTTKATTTTHKVLCPEPIDEDLYHSLVMKGVEPCSYIHNIHHPTPAPTRPPPPPPPVVQQHNTNLGDVVIQGLRTLCIWCG